MMRRALLATIVFLALVALITAYELRAPEKLPAPSDAPPNESASAAQTPTASISVAPAKPLEQQVVSESGVPIRLIRHRGIHVPAPPFGVAYQVLLPAAEGGDTSAQLQLGLLLYECRDVPNELATLDREVESIYQTRRHDGWDVTDPKAEETSLRERYRDCADVPVAQRLAYRDWIKRAADAGLLEAQLELQLHLPPGDYCEYLAECPPAQRAQQEALQREAVDYTTRARDAGSAAALWTFGGWYAEGEVLGANDIEAYANFRALDEINRAAGQPQRFDQMLQSLRARLRPADLATAEARANELLSNPNCCVLTP